METTKENENNVGIYKKKIKNKKAVNGCLLANN